MKRWSSSPRFAPAPLALVVLAHIGVVAAITAVHPASVQITAPALMVEVLTAAPQQPKPAQVKPQQPAPAMARPTPSRPLPAPAVVTAPKTAEATDTAVAPVAAPAPHTPAVPAAQTALPTAAPVTAAAPEPTPPRFDADYLDNPSPAYPPLSRRANEQGKVMLKVFVDAAGKPSRVEVETSSGYERLDKAAVAAVSRWKFVPARRGAEAVPDWVTVPINFGLRKSAEVS